MKINKINTILIALAGLFITSCSGNIDPENNGSDQEAGVPVFSVDKDKIIADGKDKAVLTVTLDGVDRTADASFSQAPGQAGTFLIKDNAFTTTSPGKYSLMATVDGVSSNVVTIEATKAEKPVVDSKYIRKVLLMEFTGQWCSQCPGGYNYLYQIQQLRYKDNSFIIAMHNNDDFSLPMETKMAQFFHVSGYPACVIDYRDLSPLTNDQQGKLRASVERSLKEFTSHCGVAVSSAYDEAKKTAKVTVKMTSELTGDYRLVVWVVEDDVIGRQQEGSDSNPNYHHGHVARMLVSKDWQGDKLGTVEAGKEIVKEFEIAADPAWNLENTTVYAVVLDDDADSKMIYANNMEVCAFVNGATDYAYKK